MRQGLALCLSVVKFEVSEANKRWWADARQHEQMVNYFKLNR